MACVVIVVDCNTRLAKYGCSLSCDLVPLTFICIITTQSEQKSQLKRGLASIPTPKNEFEIVVPEDEAAAGSAADAQMDEQTDYVEDQSDLDNQQYERMRAERKSYLPPAKCHT